MNPAPAPIRDELWQSFYEEARLIADVTRRLEALIRRLEAKPR